MFKRMAARRLRQAEESFAHWKATTGMVYCDGCNKLGYSEIPVFYGNRVVDHKDGGWHLTSRDGYRLRTWPFDPHAPLQRYEPGERMLCPGCRAEWQAELAAEAETARQQFREAERQRWEDSRRRGRSLGIITSGEVVYVATRRIPEGILWKIGTTTQNPVSRVRQFGGELVAYTSEVSESRVHRLLASSRVARRDLPKAIGRDAAPTEWFYGTDEVLAFAYDGKLPSGETVRMQSHVRPAGRAG